MTGFIVSVFPFRNRVSSKEAFEGLELGEGKPSRPVLRGPGGRKAAWLLGSNSGPQVRFWEVAGIDTDKRACVPLAGQLMALSKPTLAGHQRPLPPQSNSRTAFHRTVVSRRVPVAGAKGTFPNTRPPRLLNTVILFSSFLPPSPSDFF